MSSMSLLSFCRIPLGARSALSKTLALSGLVAAMLAAPAFADDAADVTKLLRAGHHAEALTKADAFLSQNPRDAQMRFLKGVILTEQNKSAEAITIFTKLTEDFPSLPEPYNNLAVLYASSGQYDKARAALDMAIRTNPSYATAYENLGDIHAKLASQAYDKALQLDSTNTGAKSKLTLLRSLAGNVGNTNQKPIVVAAATPTPAPSAPVSVKPAPAATPAVAPKAEPPVARNDTERDEVLNAVHAWAKAWSEQDVKGYLHAYGSDFKAPNGLSRSAWAEERRTRIADKGRISVRVESPQVTLNGNTATVRFRQIYESDRLKANSRKTLVLTKQGGTWQIQQEHSGS
ncbi:MAG: nuclear transport factor 2 family protein [Burkholderiaceae bacterium]